MIAECVFGKIICVLCELFRLRWRKSERDGRGEEFIHYSRFERKANLFAEAKAEGWLAHRHLAVDYVRSGIIQLDRRRVRIYQLQSDV